LLREQLLVAETQTAKLENENAVLNNENTKLRRQLEASRLECGYVKVLTIVT